MIPVSYNEIVPATYVEVDIQAKWLHPEVEPAKNELNANIFGQYGCFELSHSISNLEIPAVDLNAYQKL